MDPFDDLKQRCAVIADLNAAGGLLRWDQETHMPPGGAEPRALQLATLRALAHQQLCDPAIGRLLEQLEPRLASLDPHSDEAAILRLTRRDHDRAVKVPEELVREMAAHGARATEAWRTARRQDDFSLFRPWLEQGIALMRRFVDCFAPEGNPYDVLLDRFEPGMTQARIAGIFGAIKPRLVALAAKIAATGRADDSPLRRRVDPATQMDMARWVTEAIGFDYSRGRIDLTTHPFCSSTSYNDVRLTVRFDPDHILSGLMAAIHEAGHGLHGQNMSPELFRTMANGSTSAIAESQSRLFENNLARGAAFWRWYLPHFQQQAGGVFDDLDAETAYAAVNRVAPSLIRVQADEVTYGLHIILRFELEDALLNGEVSVADAPGVWRDKMEESLGIRPPSDATGILQDIHWSGGLFGYFPDYLLGSMLAAQLWQRMGADQPGREAAIEAGEFGDILTWSREQVMRWGRKLTIDEVAEQSTGQPLATEPYAAYLEAKYGALYGV